ncbi:MAG TPA: hypothetical protein VI122_12675 [Thermoleophilaceae bacterium]
MRTVPSGDSTGSAISFDVCSTESLSHCNDAVEVETLLDRLNVAASLIAAVPELDRQFLGGADEPRRAVQDASVGNIGHPLNLHDHIDRTRERVGAADRLPVVARCLALVADQNHRKLVAGRPHQRLERLRHGPGLVFVVAAQAGPLVERVHDQHIKVVLAAVLARLPHHLGPRRLYLAAKQNVKARVMLDAEQACLLGQRVRPLLAQ